MFVYEPNDFSQTQQLIHWTKGHCALESLGSVPTSCFLEGTETLPLQAAARMPPNSVNGCVEACLGELLALVFILEAILP